MSNSRAARAYVADVERTNPSPKKRAFTLHVNRQVAVQADRRAQVTIDAASYDAMAAARPGKPPALPANAPQVRSQAAAAAADAAKERAHKVPAIQWTGEGWKL